MRHLPRFCDEVDAKGKERVKVIVEIKIIIKGMSQLK